MKKTSQPDQLLRLNRHDAATGVLLSLFGVMGILLGVCGDLIMFIAGLLVFAVGILFCGIYCSYHLIYDNQGFTVTYFFWKKRYSYHDVSVQCVCPLIADKYVIKLLMEDGSTVSLLSDMDGVFLFLDVAFEGWCIQTGRQKEQCTFYDPSNNSWFPCKTIRQK